MKHCKISLIVKANANENKLIGWMEESLKIKIKATPVNGKANEELIKYLSQALHVEKSYIQITSGHTSNRKIVSFEGIKKEDLFQRIQNAMAK